MPEDFSFALYNWIEFLEEVLIWPKMLEEVENCLRENFDLIHIDKIVLRQSYQTRKLWLQTWKLWLALYFFQRLEKHFEVMENLKKKKFEGDWAEFLRKICLLRQFQKSIWNKIEIPSKIGQDKKRLISTFPCFLIGNTKV